MKVRKAVIPAAGWGTRFLPASKAVPKEVLPIIDKPVIQYAVEEAAASGIEHVVLVTSQNKKAVEDYFDRNFELESVLEAKGDAARLEQVRALASLVEVSSVRQQEQLGLGHAVLTAKNVVGNEPFAVILPDDVFDAATPVTRQLLGVFERYGAGVVAVNSVADEDVSRYGIIDGERVEGGAYKLSRLVEKPPLSEAPSRLAIVGRYVFTPEIFDALERTKPGAHRRDSAHRRHEYGGPGAGTLRHRIRGRVPRRRHPAGDGEVVGSRGAETPRYGARAARLARRQAARLARAGRATGRAGAQRSRLR